MRRKWIKIGYRIALVCIVISLVLQVVNIAVWDRIFLIIGGVFLAGTSLCKMLTEKKNRKNMK